MKNIFIKGINRKRYFLYLVLCHIGIFASSFLIAEVSFQESSGVMSMLMSQKIAWLPFLFIMGILLVRRRVDIQSKESGIIENIVVALVLAIAFNFAPAMKPKYFFILTAIVGFIPKLKKKEEIKTE